MTTLKGHPDVPAGTALNVRLIWDVPLQGAGRGLSPKHRDATYDWSTGKYMDGQAELTFPHPRAGQNDNALRGPLVAVYTIGTGPLSQTARYPLQAYETAPGELDITVDPNPATVVAAQTLIDLITGAAVARTQAEEAAQRVNDAILDLSAERQAVADIIADTAQAQAGNNAAQSNNNTQAAQAAAAIYQATAYAYTLASTSSLSSIAAPVAGQTALIFTSGDVYQYATGTGWAWIYNLWDAHNVKPSEMLVQRRNTKRAAVTFVMDDNPATDYTVIRPLFNAKGVKGSFALIAQSMRAGGWDEYRTLQAEGHEMMSHSLTHLNQTTLSAAALDADMRQSRDLIRAQGLRCDTYVYPYNANNATVRAVARKYYRGAAGGGNVVHTGKPLPQYNVGRHSITNTGDLPTYKSWVDAAKAQNGWIVILIHAGYDLNATQQQNLSDLLDYIAAQNVGVVTFGQGLDMFGNVLDAGDTAGGLDSDGTLFGTLSGLPVTITAGLNVLGDGTTALNNDTPPSAFPNGKISWYSVDANSKPALATGAAGGGVPGTLMVSRVRGNTADIYSQWDRQVFYEYGTNRMWTRRAATQSTWTAWSEVGGAASSGATAQIGYNSQTSTSARTAFPNNQVSFMGFNNGGGGAGGWPATAGTLWTDRTSGLANSSDSRWDRQTVYDFYSDAIWQRRAASDTAWTAWARIDAASVVVTGTTYIARDGGTYLASTTPIALPARLQFSQITGAQSAADTGGAYPTAGGGTLISEGYTIGNGANRAWTRQMWWPYGAGEVWYRTATSDTAWGTWERTAHSPAMPTTALLDFPSIPAGGQASLTVSVAGAAQGDNVLANTTSTLEAGLIWNAACWAAGVVTITLTNITAAAIDPVAKNWKVTVIR